MPTTINPLTLYFNTGAALPQSPVGGPVYTPFQVPTSLSQDQRVLAYALAAELLETQLYIQAYLYVTGNSITVTDPNTGNQTPYTAVADALGYAYGTGNVTVNSTSITATHLTSDANTNAVAAYLHEFATIEAEHAHFLIQALDGNPYPTGVSFAFNLHALTSSVAVAQAVYGAELTGVSAYLGAIASGYFTQQSPYLQTAASIQGTEARHTAALAAAINAANGNGDIETAPLYNEGLDGHGIDVPLTPDQILNAAGSSGITVPGGTIKSVSGPNGAAVGAANTTAYPSTTATYNGFVYLLS